jgi:geranylgeranyl reductase family protein
MTDVAVIGAGPSGAWAACLLARRGARVRLFDPSHPREKPCGGGVTGRALALLADTVDLTTIPLVRIRQATFEQLESDTSAAVLLARGADHDGLIVASRREFDQAILAAAERAGATLIRARVRDVGRDRSRVHIDTDAGRFDAEMLIGADGANSLVRRRFARPFSRSQLSIATGFFAFGATSDEIRIELQDDPPGYIWSFPRPDHLAIGICAQADAGVTAEGLRERVSRWISRSGIAPHARLVPYSWPIPSLSADDLTALGNPSPGCLLVGDAAGLVDPITREGIFFALQSAGLAADAIVADPSRAGALYGDHVRREIGSELARAARVKSRFFQPRFIRLLIEALNESAPIRAVMADLFAGTQGYRTLTWRLARTLEFGLAWRALQ